MTFKNRFLLRRSGDLQERDQAARQPVQEEGRVCSEGTILVAEAEASDREHLAELLRDLNFKVLTAADGETAWQLAQQEPPLLVLAAMRLPRMDGYMLAQKLRESHRTENVAFMFILEAGEIPDRVVGHETYAHDYIQKPVSVPDFKSRVLSIINLVRKRRQGATGASDLPPGRDRTKKAPKAVPPSASPATEAGTSLEEVLAQLHHLLDRLERSLKDARTESEAKESEVAAEQGGEVSPKPAVDSADSTETEGGENLERLESYRAEYQRLVKQGPVFSGQGMAERQKRAFSDMEEVRRELGERESEDDAAEDHFDLRLLKDLGVEPRGEVVTRIDHEEASSFPRESYLSAVIEDTPRREGGLELYELSRRYALDTLRAQASGEKPDLRRGAELVSRLLRDLRSGSALILEALDRSQQFSVSAHSVNVSLLAIRVAQKLGRSVRFQSRVGLCGLLHELGVVRMPEKLLFKEEPLTSEELSILRKRPLFGAQALEGTAPGIKPHQQILSQVYERANGRGFPLGLEGDEIREEARILGIADFFDACVHERPYRKPLTGYRALYEISSDPNGAFPRYLVRALIRSVSLFPYNELLLLNTGAVVRVIEINEEDLSRPMVQVLVDESGRAEQEKRLLDLSEDSSLLITEVLTADRVSEFV